MSDPVKREEKRLRRIFQRAVWLAIAAPAAIPVACAAPEPPAAEDGAADDSGEVCSDPEALDEPAHTLAFRGEAGPNKCSPVQFTPDPPDKCGKYVRLPCGLPAGVTQANNCYLWLNDCQKVCPGAYFNCHAVGDSCQNGAIVPDRHGVVEIDCATCAKGVGRIPEGLAPEKLARGPSALADYFASAAYLEAAAVHAFRRLHGELAAGRAPAKLLRAARRAQRDEVRHAQMTARMARRFGGAPVPPKVADVAPRALDAVAAENAVEGCVRETFGALVASFQAANAKDAAIARLMDGIARDETRHAALSWAIARWAGKQLDRDARAKLAARCRVAVEALRAEADTTCPPAELAERAGVPDAEQHRALVDALEQQLWRGWLSPAASA